MHGIEIDHLAAPRHLVLIETDYSLLRSVGIHTVREGIPWRWAGAGTDDACWKALDVICAASERHEMQVIFDLCHFGYPAGLDIFSQEFVDAFVDYCYAFAKRLVGLCWSEVYVTPINEPSYFAWAGGEAARFPPFCRGRAAELKTQLARASIAGTNAIWSVLPEAEIVSVDPICRTVPPRDRPDRLAEAERFNYGAVLESWDMLSGVLLPELGGSPRHLGIAGINYYWTSQWELDASEVPLAEDDERRWSLLQLVRCVWQRYNRPVLVSETAHVGEQRGPWLRQMYREAQDMLAEGIPLQGMCVYPVLGMPSWHQQDTWLDMGLWDLMDRDGACIRVPCSDAHACLESLQSLGSAVQTTL